MYYCVLQESLLGDFFNKTFHSDTFSSETINSQDWWTNIATDIKIMHFVKLQETITLHYICKIYDIPKLQRLETNFQIASMLQTARRKNNTKKKEKWR